MNVSSRTPEGYPSRCPLCGAATHLEFSERAEDAPCPSCGHLLWRSANLFSLFQQRYAELLGADPNRITVDTRLVPIDQDSLDTVEWIMGLEEEFDLDIPDDLAEKIQTIGDLIRAIEEQRRNSRE